MIITVLRSQKHLTGEKHLIERGITGVARRLLQTRTCPDLNLDDLKRHSQNLTHLAAMARPRRGNGLQAVVYMDGAQRRKTMVPGQIGQQVQQNGGIKPTREGNTPTGCFTPAGQA